MQGGHWPAKSKKGQQVADDLRAMRRQIMQGLLIQFKNQEHSGFCVENRL
jgi:hypothetical protein